MIQLNFLVERMGPSQLTYYLTLALNELADNRQDVDGIVFFNTLTGHAILPKFAMMQMAEAWGQSGYTIATSVSTSRKLLQFPGPQKKFFYVWDLEWTKGKTRNYNMYADIFCNPELKLIARSKTHAIAIMNCFNRKDIPIIDNFNSKELLEVISNNE